MIHLVFTESCYSDSESLWREIGKLPVGKLYHKVYSNSDGSYHLFSKKPITVAAFKEWYKEEFEG